MPQRPKRETADLSQDSDLVVIYLGMRVNTWTGIKTVWPTAQNFGGRRGETGWPVTARKLPLFASSFPNAPILAGLRVAGSVVAVRTAPAVVAEIPEGQRGYRVLARNLPAARRYEAVYIDMESPVGLARFAPMEPARGTMFSARKRAGIAGEAKRPEALTEEDFRVAAR